MIEENPTENPEPRDARPLTGAEKKILAAAGIIVLAAVSFMAGRFTAPVRTDSTNPNPFASQSQVQPQQPAPPISVSQLQLNMIDFTGVSQAKISAVLDAFNAKKCACGCNMTVAECVIKDPNCPMWKDHVTQIQDALGNGKKPDLSKAGNPVMNFPAHFPPAGLKPNTVPPPSKP